MIEMPLSPLSLGEELSGLNRMMTTTSPMEANSRTPCSEHMSACVSGCRPTSASAPTDSGSPTTSQAEKKDRILKCSVFLVDLTAQGAPFQASPNDVQGVVDRLRDIHKVTHVTLFSGGNSTKDKPRLPFDGFKVETRSYEPLTHLFNITIHAANMCLTRPRYLEGLHFYPYGAEMREKLDSTKPLKPDILGFHSRTPYEEPVSWNDVAVFIAVKANLFEAIKQLSTYACPHLTLNRRRSFSIAMSFDPTTMILHILCFYRPRISASPALHLNREDGFKSFDEHMVGLLSIKDEEAFGLDVTCTEDAYRLNGTDYKIMRTIHARGHSPAVYSLKSVE
jgi:hypothetical protein